MASILRLRRLYCQAAEPQRIDHGPLVAKEKLARPDLARREGFELRPRFVISPRGLLPKKRAFPETGLSLRYLWAEMISFCLTNIRADAVSTFMATRPLLRLAV